MSSSDVFTIETSHGPARLTRPRPSDVGSVLADRERAVDRDARGRFRPGNRVGAERAAKAALTAPLKRARRAVQQALRDAVEPAVADSLMTDALAVYRAARRELGSSSVLVTGPLVRFAVQSVLAQHFQNLAATAGLGTKRGMALLAMGHACEARSERAETMALAAVKALHERQAKRPQNNPILAAIEAAGRPARELSDPGTASGPTVSENASQGQPGATELEG